MPPSKVPKKASKPEREWDRIPGESGRAYDAFSAYLEMGPDRSMVRLAKQLGRGWRGLYEWSRNFGWSERAAAYDAHLITTFREAEVKARRGRAAVLRKLREKELMDALEDSLLIVEKARQSLALPAILVRIEKGQPGLDGKPAENTTVIKGADPRTFSTATKMLVMGRDRRLRFISQGIVEGEPLPESCPPDADADATRDVEFRRLRASAENWLQRGQHDPEAMIVYLRISESIRRLQGLDAPPAAPVPAGSSRPSPRYIMARVVEPPPWEPPADDDGPRAIGHSNGYANGQTNGHSNGDIEINPDDPDSLE